MSQEKKQKVQSVPSLSYTVEVRDKEGRIIQRISAPSRSYVQQWNQFLNVHTTGANKTLTDVAGNPQSVGRAPSSLRVDGGIGADYGIRIGKGTTAVAITDYTLETPCTEGGGLNQFKHQAVQFTEPAVAGPTCSFTLRRTMINDSGAAISGIKEIGVEISGGVDNFLAFRDVLGSAVEVPDGGAIRVTYTVGVTA